MTVDARDQAIERQHEDVDPLHVVVEGAATRLVDAELGTWVLEVVPLDVMPKAAQPVSQGIAASLVGSLAEAFPQFKNVMSSGQGVAVRFSPEVEKGLREGAYRLMDSAAGTKAMARSASTGQFVEHGTVVAGGGLVLAGVSWPIIAAGAVAVAASVAHQRWLEDVFGDLEAGLARLAQRLVDDDDGELDAAEQLIELIADSAMFGHVSPLVVAEVAEARRRVEAIYFSRRRYAARFKEQLEARQREAGTTKSGQPKTWTADIAREVVDEDQGVIEELALFFRAMIARARLGTIAASILIAEGSYDTALRMLHQTKVTMRNDYFDLHNRLGALARHEPEPGVLDKVPLLKKTARGLTAREKVQALAGGADHAIGDRLLDEPPALELVVLSQGLGQTP